jgi:hypothetical protein
MKKMICALLVMLALAAPLSANAFETPLTDPKGIEVLEKLGKYFKPVADQFGCTEFAWGTVANEGKLASLEYVPPGVKVAEWKRLMTITVYSLTGDAVQNKVEMLGIVGALTKQYETNGRLISKSLYKNNADEASAFFEYETGLGAAKEHNAGIFMRVTPTLAAFMQIQSRPGALAAEDSLKIHKMANPQLKTEEKK